MLNHLLREWSNSSKELLRSRELPPQSKPLPKEWCKDQSKELPKFKLLSKESLRFNSLCMPQSQCMKSNTSPLSTRKRSMRRSTRRSLWSPISNQWFTLNHQSNMSNLFMSNLNTSSLLRNITKKLLSTTRRKKKSLCTSLLPNRSTIQPSSR